MAVSCRARQDVPAAGRCLRSRSLGGQPAEAASRSRQCAILTLQNQVYPMRRRAGGAARRAQLAQARA